MIYFLRHGESCSNAGEKNVYDSPLTEKGRKQAKKITGHADYIICSPMRRAKETLIYSKITYDQMEINSLCREKKCSLSSTLLFEDTTKESADDFKIRMHKLCQYIIGISEHYDNIMVVCHGCVISSITQISPKNCEIIECNIDILRDIVNSKNIYEYKCC